MVMFIVTQSFIPLKQAKNKVFIPMIHIFIEKVGKEVHCNNSHIVKNATRMSPGAKCIYADFVFHIKDELLTNPNHLCSLSFETVTPLTF